MDILCLNCQPTTTYTENIILSIISSAIFGIIIFLAGLLYDYLKYLNHVATYHRPYIRSNPKLKGQIASIAKVSYKGKGELVINVTTLIHEHHDDPINDYIFPESSIQEWKGIVTMENEEAGKLYFYYLRPTDQRKEMRSHFKRILFLHNSRHLKLFGEAGWEEELFDKK